MSRGLHANMLAAIIAGTVTPFILFKGEFESGWVRLWTGYGDLTWDSQTWSGVGDLMSLSPIAETGDVQALGITVGLSGIPQSFVSIVYTEARQGKDGIVYIGAFNSSGAIVSNPFLAFSGRLDVPTDFDDGETAKITITYENRLVDLERPRERRYTPEDQAIDYPTDKGFDQVASLQDAQITWGRS